MQRKLFIVRHGKSSWETVVDDFDRPLAERGISNSYDMAKRLLREGLVPEEIYSSPANRALHTAIIMSRVWNLGEDKVHICEDLYLPSIDDIAGCIFRIPDQVTSAAVYGHNPGFTQFANRFLHPRIDNVPTAGVVILTLEMDSWTDLYNAKIVDEFVDFPKNRPRE